MPEIHVFAVVRERGARERERKRERERGRVDESLEKKAVERRDKRK